MQGNDEAKRAFVAAFASIYAQSGMKGISAATVAQKAGYSRSSFYRCFESVYDVLAELEDQAVPTRDFAYLAEHANTVTMEEITQIILDALVKREPLIRALSIHADDNHFYEKFRLAFKPVMLGQIKRVYILEPYEYDVMAEYITAAKLSVMRYWALHDLPRDAIARLTQLTDSMFEGLLWERVNKASLAQRAGQPYQRTPLSYFTDKYEWIRVRLPEDPAT